MDVTIKWQDTDGQWQNFDCEDINHLPRNHALHLFSLGVPVVAKEGREYVVNSKKLLTDYQHKRQPVRLMSDCQKSAMPFGAVGFLVSTEQYPPH